MIPISPWLSEWPVTYPRVRGDWTVRGPRGWARLVPETGRVRPYDPQRDHRLPGLRVAATQGRIVGYRWGRRAVVDAGDRFIKVVRASRLELVAQRHQTMAEVLGGACAHPRLVGTDARGWVDLTRVEGESLHDLLVRAAHADGPCDVEEAIERAVDVLLRFHKCSAGDRLEPIQPTAASEWRQMLERTGMALDDRTLEALATVATPAVIPSVPVHGDLHDKNVMLSRRGPTSDGVIDLDSAALGTPEFDIANLAAHLVLRAMQGGWGVGTGARWALLALEGYDRGCPLDEGLVDDVLRSTWLRLACIYRYRAKSLAFVPVLLDLATAPRPQGELRRLAAALAAETRR